MMSQVMKLRNIAFTMGRNVLLEFDTWNGIFENLKKRKSPTSTESSLYEHLESLIDICH